MRLKFWKKAAEEENKTATAAEKASDVSAYQTSSALSGIRMRSDRAAGRDRELAEAVDISGIYAEDCGGVHAAMPARKTPLAIEETLPDAVRVTLAKIGDGVLDARTINITDDAFSEIEHLVQVQCERRNARTEISRLHAKAHENAVEAVRLCREERIRKVDEGLEAHWLAGSQPRRLNHVR